MQPGWCGALPAPSDMGVSLRDAASGLVATRFESGLDRGCRGKNVTVSCRDRGLICHDDGESALIFGGFLELARGWQDGVDVSGCTDPQTAEWQAEHDFPRQFDPENPEGPKAPSLRCARCGVPQPLSRDQRLAAERAERFAARVQARVKRGVSLREALV